MDNLITLYYVDGISKTDTPYFDTELSQTSYFSRHTQKVISSSYYPPFFNDTIKFENDDLDVNVLVNYLSVYYLGRYYYYFINAIRYSSRGIIECDIEMDTIQTFYFNFTTKNSIIERKFINRWIGNTINRGYIRENVSEGNFKLQRFTKYTKDDMSDWFLISKFDSYDKTSASKSVSTGASIRGEHSEISCTDVKLSTLSICSTEGISGGSLNTLIYAGTFISSAYVDNYLDNYICPFPPLEGLSVEYVTDHYHLITSSPILNPSISYLNYEGMQGETINYLDLSKSVLNIALYNKQIEFPFSKNIQKEIPFIPSYCPALLDNNYIDLTFGSYSTNTTYPLYELKQAVIYAHYYFSYLSGQRVYLLNAFETSLNDDFRTTVIDTNILYYDLKNVPWSNYVSSNKYRWSQLTANSVSNISSNMLSVSEGNIKGNYAINDILSNKRSYTPKRGNLKLKYQRAVDKISFGNNLDLASGIADSGLSAINDISNQYYKEKNLLATPSTLKQTGNANGASGANGMTIFSSVYLVDDFVPCAYYYHLNGYLVTEYISSTDTNDGNNGLFDIVNTRFYYSMIKLSQCSVHMADYIEATNITEDIEDRLISGLRLWNVNDSGISIGDFTYDNVEKDYLQ